MSSTQGKQQLKNNIQANNHEIYILSVDEMDKVVKSSSAKLNEESNSIWQSLKGKLENGVGYYANFDDAKVMTKLVGDLGSFGSQVYIKN